MHFKMSTIIMYIYIYIYIYVADFGVRARGRKRPAEREGPICPPPALRSITQYGTTRYNVAIYIYIYIYIYVSALLIITIKMLRLTYYG